MHAGVRFDQHQYDSRQSAAYQATGAALAELDADGWLVLRDLQRPGRRFASIDHIAVGPGGVVVIDTRDWTGQIDVRAGVLHQNGASRARECELAEASAAAVTAWLEPGQRTAVMPLVCLVGQPTPTQQPSITAVYGVEEVAATLRALPGRLRTGEVWAVADLLRRTLADGSIPVQLTTASLATAMAETPAGLATRGRLWSGRVARVLRLGQVRGPHR